MKILILSLSLFFLACSTTSKTERIPAQSLDNYYLDVGTWKEPGKELYLTSYVQVASAELPADQLREVKRTCRAQMALKMLQFSPELKALHHADMDLRVSDTKDTIASRGKYFDFTLVGTDNNKYRGYIYIHPEKNEDAIASNGSHSVYYCDQSFDNWTDFAQLKDARGNLVFSSSYATRSLNGENINERGNKIPKKKR